MINQLPCCFGDPTIHGFFSLWGWLTIIFRSLKSCFHFSSGYFVRWSDGECGTLLPVCCHPPSCLPVDSCNHRPMVGVMVVRHSQPYVPEMVSIPLPGQQIIRLGANPSIPSLHSPCPPPVCCAGGSFGSCPSVPENCIPLRSAHPFHP